MTQRRQQDEARSAGDREDRSAPGTDRARRKTRLIYLWLFTLAMAMVFFLLGALFVFEPLL